MKARNRPPRLESRVGVQTPAPPPTTEQRLTRAKIAGRGPVGPTELRRLVDRLVAGDPGVLGCVAAFDVTASDVWDALKAVYGSAPDKPEIDPAAVVVGAQRAGDRIVAAARAGARIAFATAAPASMLAIHMALARRARTAGAVVADDDDAGPARIDGRSPRWIRWIGGVAVVTDGAALVGASGADAPREWLFHLGRPQLVVADGPFAEAAFDEAIEVVSFAGLDRISLAVPAAGGDRCTVVPVHGGRPPRAYEPLLGLFDEPFTAAPAPEE